MQGLYLDLRYCLRGVWRRGSWAASTVATIALVVGLLTALFSALYGLLLHQYSFPNADRIVMLWESNRDTGSRHLPVTESAYPIYRDELSHSANFAYFVPPEPGYPTKLADTGERVVIARAAPELFGVFGIVPLHGRLFLPEEGVYPAKRVVLLSHDFWVSRFGARKEAVGSELRLTFGGSREIATIVGVLPRGFRFPYPLYPQAPDLWVNSQRVPGPFLPGNNFHTIALLRPGTDVTHFRVALGRVARGIADAQPRWYGAMSVEATSLSHESFRDARGVVTAVGVTFVAVVLIGCSNLIHLLLARAASRRKDTAIRLALGATAQDLARVNGVELGLLSAAGCGLGFIIAYAGVRALGVMLPSGIYLPRADALLSDASVLTFAVTAWAGIGLVLGWAMWRTTKAEVAPARPMRRASVGSRRRLLFRGFGRRLIICEVALASSLVVAALSMADHLRQVMEYRDGPDPTRLLAMHIMFPPEERPRAIPALTSALADVSAAPDVEAAALVDEYPFSGFKVKAMAPQVEGPMSRAWQPCELHIVTPSYREVLGPRILEGRWLEPADGRLAPTAAVIDETMARRYFKGASPIGKILKTDRRDLGDEFVVVGVVRQPNSPGQRADSGPTVYVSWERIPLANVTLILRTSNEARKVAGSIRRNMERMAPGVVEIRDILTGADLIAAASQRTRFVATQLLGVGVLGLVLAASGIYGVVSLWSSTRVKEVAVRMALGATRPQVIRLVLKEVLLLVAVGVIAGLPLSLFGRRLLEDVNQDGQRVSQGAAFVVTTGMFVLIAIAASLPSARRAASVDPSAALRAED